MEKPPPLSNAGVLIPPPLIFLAGLAMGWMLDRQVRALPLVDVRGEALTAFGVALIVCGIGLAVWGMATFRRASTAIMPFRSASALVITGPYRFTRNPMYTGMMIAYLGAAVLINSVWVLILLPLVMVLMYTFVIAREERYLAEAFGSDYDDYRARVGRWL